MEVIHMNYLIILNSNYLDHFDQVHKTIEDYDHTIRVNQNTWLINTKYDAVIIRQHLANVMSMHDSLLIFQVNEKFSIANQLDVSDWLEDMQQSHWLTPA